MGRLINFRASPELEERIDTAATAVGVDRSTWIRAKLEQALAELDEVPEPVRQG